LNAPELNIVYKSSFFLGQPATDCARLQNFEKPK